MDAAQFDSDAWIARMAAAIENDVSRSDAPWLGLPSFANGICLSNCHRVFLKKGKKEIAHLSGAAPRRKFAICENARVPRAIGGARVEDHERLHRRILCGPKAPDGTSVKASHPQRRSWRGGRGDTVVYQLGNAVSVHVPHPVDRKTGLNQVRDRHRTVRENIAPFGAGMLGRIELTQQVFGVGDKAR